MSPPSYKEQFW